jgi:hypothetical protein
MSKTANIKGAYIKGIGSYLPARILSNEQLAQTVDTSDAWIRERTGIMQRHIAAEGQNTSDLGYHAALEALSDAKMSTDDVDIIIVATSTPDLTFPATATIIQEKLGIHHGAAFDVQAVCSGFIYALSVADAMIRAGNAQNILVIGAETFSRILDWNDRSTCVLFGDGAGAMILSADKPDVKNAGEGILNTYIAQMVVTVIFSMWTVALRPRKRLVNYGWSAIRCFAVRCANFQTQCYSVPEKWMSKLVILTGLSPTKPTNVFLKRLQKN